MKDKSSLLEFGRKHFFAVGDSWLYHIPAQLCCLHPVLDKLLAPLSPQVGRFLDSEAESRCLMNWGDLADVWPFPGPLWTDGPFSFTALVIYSATAPSSFPHSHRTQCCSHCTHRRIFPWMQKGKLSVHYYYYYYWHCWKSPSGRDVSMQRPKSMSSAA